MSAEVIINSWKKQNFKPIYWLEGEEEYFIDKIIDYAEHHILNESEASFNLSIFYGKDSGWAEIINACRRYPMFAERQVVIIKEAQLMRNVEKLEAYIENPLSSTIFVVAYKDKKLDARKVFAKLIKEKGELLTTKKMYDNELPAWTQQLIQKKGLTITQKGLRLVVDHIGNDLTRIENEIDKLMVNLGDRKNITEDDIELYIGISKEFNVFELQSALAAKDLPTAIRIIQYFEANPKAATIQEILPKLYSFFSKVFMIFGAGTRDEKLLATNIGVTPYFLKQYVRAAELYQYPGIERTLLLLNQYNLKSVGIGDTGTETASLLKELVIKMMS